MPVTSTSIVKWTALSECTIKWTTFLSNPVIKNGSDGLPLVTLSRRQTAPQPCGFPKDHRSSVLPNHKPDWDCPVTTLLSNILDTWKDGHFFEISWRSVLKAIFCDTDLMVWVFRLILSKFGLVTQRVLVDYIGADGCLENWFLSDRRWRLGIIKA